ncbi:MAG TPA: Rpn family recombination-promoting nuclease/putative transposase [bacterium]|nr:Rpn family recombination-promoting nuclease/putative transposase [bacterium]
MKFADPKSNIAFKKVFGNENKKEILISFLNAILDLKKEKEIVDIKILNPYQAPKIEMLKETMLDVRAKDRRGITFIVEMQVEKQAYFDKRSIYYTSKAYVNQIERGEDYPKLNQVIFIGILNFNIFESKNYITRHLILNTETYKQELKDIEFTFIELPKFKKKEKEIKTIVEKWIYFLKNAGELKIIPAKLKKPKEILEAFKIVEVYNWSKRELEVYEYWSLKEGGREETLKKEREEGIKEGLEKGAKLKEIEIVKNLIRMGLSEEEIIKATGIKSEELRAINERI